MVGDVGEREFFRVMLRDIRLDLVHDAVGDAAVFTAQTALVLAHPFQVQQQRGQQHLAGRLVLRGLLLLQGKDLLQHRLDVVLLLDAQTGQQVVVLLVEEGTEIQLRERLADLIQILVAEIHHDAAGRAVPHRVGLVDLVFSDQHHIARIDNVGGVLDKIPPGSLHLIIDFKFMVNVEGVHVVRVLTVHLFDVKIHMG